MYSRPLSGKYTTTPTRYCTVSRFSSRSAGGAAFTVHGVPTRHSLSVVIRTFWQLSCTFICWYRLHLGKQQQRKAARMFVSPKAHLTVLVFQLDSIPYAGTPTFIICRDWSRNCVKSQLKNRARKHPPLGTLHVPRRTPCQGRNLPANWAPVLRTVRESGENGRMSNNAVMPTVRTQKKRSTPSEGRRSNGLFSGLLARPKRSACGAQQSIGWAAQQHWEPTVMGDLTGGDARQREAAQGSRQLEGVFPAQRPYVPGTCRPSPSPFQRT